METLRQLTEIEKAALTYKYYNGVKSFEPAFIICHQDKKGLKPTSLKTLVSHWKHAPEVQNYLAELEIKDKTRIAKYAGSIRTKPEPGQNNENGTGTDNSTGIKTDENGAENNNGISFAPDWVNFRDLDSFLNFCETQANLLTDEKDRQTYLKMISELMQYKNRDSTNDEIQRFYLPLSCQYCPLYQEKSKLQ